jgi:hypothetical protein
LYRDLIYPTTLSIGTHPSELVALSGQRNSGPIKIRASVALELPGAMQLMQVPTISTFMKSLQSFVRHPPKIVI